MSSSPHYLSIDLGTSSCKICLIDACGNVVKTVSRRYPTHTPLPGWAEQEPNDWLEAVRLACSSLFSDPDIGKKRIAAIIPTGAAHIGVLTDASARPLRRAILWSDQRSGKECEYLMDQAGDLIYEQTYNRVSTTWTLPHLLWIRRNDPDAWAEMKFFELSKDFLIHHLTENRVTDAATAASSMIYSSAAELWSDELCALLGLDPVILPEIRKPGEMAGTLDSRGSSILGLPGGIPVFTGSLDGAMETYGAGARMPGDYDVRIRTAGGVHVIKAAPRPDPKLLTYPYVMDGLWYSQAGTNSAGSSISWAMKITGHVLEEDGFIAFRHLAEKAPPGCMGLMFHPYLSGERTPYWNPDLRGSFTGISPVHSGEHFARAVLEGVAFSLFDALTALNDLSSLPPSIRVVGGGASEPLLMHILCSVLGRDVLAMNTVDSSYGAALFALSREEESVSGQARGSSVGKLYIANQDQVEVYQNLFEMYKRRAKQLILMYDGTKDE